MQVVAIGKVKEKLAGMLSVRRAVVAGRRVRQAVYLVSLVLFMGAALLALDGVWAGAIPVLVVAVGGAWLAGVWVKPHSGDAYIRRVYRVWRDWVAGTRVSYGQFARKQADFPERLRALSPPPVRLADHNRLVLLVEEHERLRSRHIASSTDAFELTTAQEAARRAKDDLQAACSESAASYATDLDRLFRVRMLEYAAAAVEAERETGSALHKLERMRPPLSTAAQHVSLVQAFRAQLNVAHQFHAASEAADPARVAAAMQAWTESVTALREAVQRISDSVGYAERWPTPELPAAASERSDG